jgi:hypothetical protein
LHHQRELFREIATAWASSFPQSAEALEALAISHDMLGDPAAIDKIRKARALATTDDQRVRFAGTEAWMRLKQSVPAQSDELILVRALADSLLPRAASPTAVQPMLLASLAALTGRANLAAALTRNPAASADFFAPAAVARSGLPLLVFAAFGGPLDSLRELEQQVDATIDNQLITTARQEARMNWLVRPARLAFPDYQFASLSKLVGTGDWLIDAEAALLRRDTVVALRGFAMARAARRSAPSSDVNFEGLYPEARVLTTAMDARAGIAWLDGTLRALPSTDPQSFVNPANAAALVRAMELRADLADQTGDVATARRWARVVTILWSDCDPFLQPIVQRMRKMAGAI